MKFKGMTKKEPGRFITRYDLEYETEKGNKKIYEMISRDSGMETESDLTESDPEAVVLIMTDETGEKLLLNREFRMATGTWVYNFPAGLIDPGEKPEESAKRELWEETGLELLEISDVLGPCYSAVGFCNEKNVCIIGKAGGEFHESTSDEEEIRAGWFTKEQIRELIYKEPFAARTQAFCYLWAGSVE